jgi:hypothetical protein
MMNIARRNQLLCLGVAIFLGVVGYRGLTKPGPTPPGSPLAARFLAAEYVGISHKTEPVYVYEAPVIQAGKAVVKTVFGKTKNNECIVRMIRSEQETKYGWLVESMACGKIDKP